MLLLRGRDELMETPTLFGKVMPANGFNHIILSIIPLRNSAKLRVSRLLVS